MQSIQLVKDCKWIDFSMCLVIQDNCKQATVTCVHCLQCEQLRYPYKAIMLDVVRLANERQAFTSFP